MNEFDIFSTALELRSSEERMRYLDKTCGDNAERRRRVEALLRSHAAAGSFMDLPAAPVPAVSGHERPGAVIGPYKLLQLLGEGGMGVVYMAQQTQPIQRKVALKVIKPGLDSRQVIARFEVERQALALMDHVNIARVLDAGAIETPGEGLKPPELSTTLNGPLTTPEAHAPRSATPYFVMELIHGVPITNYCDDNKLTPRERLTLFVQVCQAIQHAHQKGIIHRDIKPSNVMITHYDGKPVPKVIDFGVAKAIEQKLTEKTMFTQYGVMVGTFEYMSPEQAEMSALGVDTRSDIYSLGVLFYELLTGSTPLLRQRVRESTYAEILRIIREEEPPKPSTRLSDSGDTLIDISARRQTEPVKLTRLVRGDLDWIALRALEKDRNRRYESASALAADVERYLNDEPVQACPPSTSYRLRKLARRNKGPVLAVSLIVIALVAGIIGTAIGLVRAQEARADEENQRQLAEANAKEARDREAETRAILSFVQNRILAATRPEAGAGLGHDAKLIQVIEAALPFVETSFKDQPLIEARLRMTLAESFVWLGRRKTAIEQFQRARKLYAEYAGPEHPDTMRCMHDLANNLGTVGRNAESIELFESTLALRRRVLGADNSDTLATMSDMASYLSAGGRFAESLKLHEETLALTRAKFGPDSPRLLSTMINQAILFRRIGRLSDAVALHEKTLVLSRAIHSADHQRTLRCMIFLADSYKAVDRDAEALALLKSMVPVAKAKMGPHNELTCVGMNSLAFTHCKLGQYADAILIFEEVLANRKTKPGLDDAELIEAMINVATNCAIAGQDAKAISHWNTAYALAQAKLGPQHGLTLDCMQGLARSLSTAEIKHRDVRRALQLAKARSVQMPQRMDSWITYGMAQYRTGDVKGSILSFEKAVSLLTPRDRVDRLAALFLAMAYWQDGRKDDARAWHSKAGITQGREVLDQQNVMLLRLRLEAMKLIGGEIRNEPPTATGWRWRARQC